MEPENQKPETTAPLWSTSEISPPPPSFHPIHHSAANAAAPGTASHTQQSIILAPVPQAQPVSTVFPPFHFQIPSKRITSPSDALRFVNSPSGQNFLGFVVSLSDSVRGRKISDPCHISSTVQSIIHVLEKMLRWIDEIPPAAQSSRYGRKHGKLSINR